MDEKTTELLNQLATKLGTTTEHLWGVLTAQAKVDIAQDLLASVFMLGFMLFLLKLHDRFLNWWRDDYGVAPLAFIIGIPVGFFLLAALIAIFESIVQIPTKLFNPEYFAFREIGKFIK